jgi:23S rRNA (uracil1939-C5)-methyltransferase
MEGLKFKIGPKSFFQTNSEQAYKLYSVVRDYASLSGNEIVFDLYTGTGTIALFLASRASKVIGIEYIPEAIEDARVNAMENDVFNCSFYACDIKKILTLEFVKNNGHPDVIILDPPRAGIHPDIAKVIVETKPSKVVYVSCNPATQARDISLMSEFYSITAIQPVDMFPHTHHVENVVKLELK